MKKLFCFVTTLIVTAMLIANFKLVYASTEGEVNADSVNLRQKASTSSDIIQSLDKGAKVTIQSEEGSFYKVIYNSKVGYISKDYVSKVDDTSNTDNSTNNDNQNTNTDNNTGNGSNDNNIDDTETLTEEEAMNKNKVKLNSDETVYALPLLNSSKLGTISTDEEVTLVSINGSWAYIRTSKMSGWVNKTSLSSQTVYLPTTAKKTSNNDTTKTDNNEDLKNNTANNSENNTVTKNETNNTNTATNAETNTTSNTATNTETNTTNGNATSNENNNPTNTSSKEMYVNVDAVNVRAEPSTSATVLSSVEKSNKVEVLDTSNGEWYKIKTSAGTTGYVLAQYLSANK